MINIKQKIIDTISAIIYLIGQVYFFSGNVAFLICSTKYFQLSSHSIFFFSERTKFNNPDYFDKIIIAIIIAFAVTNLGLYLIHKLQGVYSKIILYLGYIYFLIGTYQLILLIFAIYITGGIGLSSLLNKEESFPLIIWVCLSFLGSNIIFKFKENQKNGKEVKNFNK